MLCRVYKRNGICIRNHCGAEPSRHIEPPGLVRTVGRRDRVSTWYAADDRVKASASAARGRSRGIHAGRTPPALHAKTRTTSGGGYVAVAVHSALARARG